MGTKVSKSKSSNSRITEISELSPVVIEKEKKIKILNKKVELLEEENDNLRSKVQNLVKQLEIKGDVDEFLENFSPNSQKKSEHQLKDNENRNIPLVGDRVVSMWSSSQWQYFTAKVVDFDKDSLKYTIDWDDGDPTGRTVDYFNLALDRIPDADAIGVNSEVLFQQGKYKSTQVAGVNRSAGLRWHQGIIDKVTTESNGTKLYSGRHSKGANDGKWITYKDYSYVFSNYRIQDFRLPPNVFDVLSIEDDGNEAVEPDYDVYMSYTKVNSPHAIKNDEVAKGDLPPSYEEAVLENLCDPRDIAENLISKGIKVCIVEDESYLKIVVSLKRSKVFIACLSDEYANNNRCRMEFQYAKKTMNIPVIPIVVGTNSFQWQMTVVGLLIAGDLYIHFKNKQVEEAKMTELCTTLQTQLPKLKITNVQHVATGDARMQLNTNPEETIVGKKIESKNVEMFFSYCWSNSFDAFEKKQVDMLKGNKWNDPRTILKKLSASTGMHSWMDVDKLRGADEMGLFGQIATAIGQSKLVICCVSSEYVNSANCRMEIQFAVKSLKKPTIAVIVGDSSDWKETAVGKLVMSGITFIDFQNTRSSEHLELKLREMEQLILQTTEISLKNNLPITEEVNSTLPKFRAPVFGDHVVCLHQNWAYFMATIENFYEETMQYEVHWDDGDPSGTIQSYQDVALDVFPRESDIGIGSIVLFPQGSYGVTENNNSGGTRYHQGKVTRIYRDSNEVTRYSGIHTKSAEFGKWVTYKEYSYTFEGYLLTQLRISPNPMDALMACREAYKIKE